LQGIKAVKDRMAIKNKTSTILFFKQFTPAS
jgi:hypothetical protein